MRKRLLLFGILCLIAVGIFSQSIIAQEPFFPEPPRTSEVPDDVVWDTRAGMYIHKDFEWDPVKGDVIPKKGNSVMSDTEVKGDIDSFNGWFNAHNNSENSIDQAILKFNREIRQDTKYLLSSKWDPKGDIHIRELADILGIKSLPGMIEKIENGEVVQALLISTIEVMTEYNYPNPTFTTNENIEQWKKEFKQRVSQAPELVKSEASKEEIQRLGMFAVPFIIDDLQNGNEEKAELLPEIVAKYSKSDVNELKGKNSKYWKEWANTHASDLKVLRDIVNK